MRHVGFQIGPDGTIIPNGEWRDFHPNYCKEQARSMHDPSTLMDFKIVRLTERSDGVTRNQLTVFARLSDAETGVLTHASEGEATNMTGEHAGEGTVADALERAFANMAGVGLRAPGDPCGAVRLEHVSGEEVGDPYVFQAGFQGHGQHLVYTWDFGDGATAEGRSLQRARHGYETAGDYDVTVRVPGRDGAMHSQTIRVHVDDGELDAATCTFTATVSGAIVGEFEGTATVMFDSEGGAAQVTDLTLEAEGFDLSVGLYPSSHRVGAAETTHGTMATAGHGPDVREEAFGFFALQEDYGDFVSVDIEESRIIPWSRLPESLQSATAEMFGGGAGRMAEAMAAMSREDRARYEAQVGDVVVRGTLEGQLTQNGGKLVEALGPAPEQIAFDASFDAGGNTFACDYEGFPERIRQQWEDVRRQMEDVR